MAASDGFSELWQAKSSIYAAAKRLCYIPPTEGNVTFEKSLGWLPFYDGLFVFCKRPVQNLSDPRPGDFTANIAYFASKPNVEDVLNILLEMRWPEWSDIAPGQIRLESIEKVASGSQLNRSSLATTGTIANLFEYLRTGGQFGFAGSVEVFLSELRAAVAIFPLQDLLDHSFSSYEAGERRASFGIVQSAIPGSPTLNDAPLGTRAGRREALLVGSNSAVWIAAFRASLSSGHPSIDSFDAVLSVLGNNEADDDFPSDLIVNCPDAIIQSAAIPVVLERLCRSILVSWSNLANDLCTSLAKVSVETREALLHALAIEYARATHARPTGLTTSLRGLSPTSLGYFCDVLVVWIGKLNVRVSTLPNLVVTDCLRESRLLQQLPALRQELLTSQLSRLDEIVADSRIRSDFKAELIVLGVHSHTPGRAYAAVGKLTDSGLLHDVGKSLSAGELLQVARGLFAFSAAEFYSFATVALQAESWRQVYPTIVSLALEHGNANDVFQRLPQLSAHLLGSSDLVGMGLLADRVAVSAYSNIRGRIRAGKRPLVEDGEVRLVRRFSEFSPECELLRRTVDFVLRHSRGGQVGKLSSAFAHETGMSVHQDDSNDNDCRWLLFAEVVGWSPANNDEVVLLVEELDFRTSLSRDEVVGWWLDLQDRRVRDERFHDRKLSIAVAVLEAVETLYTTEAKGWARVIPRGTRYPEAIDSRVDHFKQVVASAAPQESARRK